MSNEHTSVEGQAVTQQTKRTKQVTGFVKVVLWFAFAAFLITSIPHVAWLYHEFERGESSTVFGIDTWWVLSYMSAIGIDATVACLAYMLEIGVKKMSAGFIWVFTLLLISLSWYANFLYSMAHNPVQQSDVWGIQVLFGLTTTGYVTPVVISAAPVFVVAYTFMIQLVGDGNTLTSEELNKRAIEFENLQVAKERIRNAKRQAAISSITGVFDAGKAVVTHVTNQDETTVTPSLECVVKETPVEYTAVEHVEVHTVQSGTENSIATPDPSTFFTAEEQDTTPIDVLLASVTREEGTTTTGENSTVYVPAYKRKKKSLEA